MYSNSHAERKVWKKHLIKTDFTARCYAERGYATVCRLSVRLPVTLKYDLHTGWNTSKIISRPNGLRLLLGLTPIWAIWCNGNTAKIRVE